jgi:FtsH-binding integral membrane protein
MSYQMLDYADQDGFAVDAAVDERIAFIRRVYAHLLGATLLFVGCCTLFVTNPVLVRPILGMVFAGQWWLLMIGFMAASWAAQRMAMSQTSRGVQYLGLGMYAVVEAVIFSPLMLMLMTRHQNGAELLMQGGTLTLVIFGGLTAIVMLTRSDFSFLRNVLWLATLAAIGLAVVASFSGFSLGLLFVSAMIVLFSGWILYDTSNVLHHYPTNMHVAAALNLFASLATLFWYVLRLLSILNRD